MLYIEPDEIDPQVPEAQRTALARIVTGQIIQHTRSWVYPVDDEGLPTYSVIGQAFKDAAQAQVNAILEAGAVADVVTGGATSAAVVASTSSNGKSVSLDHSTAQAAKQGLIQGRLCPEAQAILNMMRYDTLPGVIR